MKRNRILIIGGVEAGPRAASRARWRDPDAEITIVERGRLLSYAGCGLPYYVEGKVPELHDLMSTAGGVVRDAAFFQNVKTSASSMKRWLKQLIGPAKVVRTVHLTTGEKAELPYDKLMLARGGVLIEPPSQGVDFNHVFRLNHADAPARGEWGEGARRGGSAGHHGGASDARGRGAIVPVRGWS